ncbi:ATP-binding protein [Streptomyces sp. NPDC088554]|uniref:ATP-binding protein n=1 Tax=Streptomyces sp. NPDC088554 TaxID=3365865 RepID=UPI003809DDA4
MMDCRVSAPPYLSERVHRREQINLSPVNSAAGSSRLFIRSTLTRWDLLTIADDALLVTSELVTNATRATGPPHEAEAIQLHVLALESSVVIEVWDASRAEPVLPARPALPPDSAFDEGECGRGLLLVDSVAGRWGSRPAPSGKVVWAELTLPPPLPPALPVRRKNPVPKLQGPPAEPLDKSFLLRVLGGLKEL